MGALCLESAEAAWEGRRGESPVDLATWVAKHPWQGDRELTPDNSNTQGGLQMFPKGTQESAA